MNSSSCKCGRIRGELNKTNWTRHLESCGKKRKLHSTSITSFFKLPVKTSSTTTLPLPTRRTEQNNDNTLNTDLYPAMLCEIEKINDNTLDNTDIDPATVCAIDIFSTPSANSFLNDPGNWPLHIPCSMKGYYLELGTCQPTPIELFNNIFPKIGEKNGEIRSSQIAKKYYLQLFLTLYK